MKLIDNYNRFDRISILTYAKYLIGRSFNDVLQQATLYEDGCCNPNEMFSLQNKFRKGGLGNLIEKYYFGYALNNNSEADFSQAGMELKVTPFQINAKNQLVAGERLVLSKIDFTSRIDANELKASHVWKKCAVMLLIYYFRDLQLKRENRRLDYLIYFVSLVDFNLPDFIRDVKIMEQDYRKIIAKIHAGKADEISEADTMYLGACTKGATSEKSMQLQFYPASDGNHYMARGRAFCLKTSYMTYLLNHYIVPNSNSNSNKESERLVDYSTTNFEEEIRNRIHSYLGWEASKIASSLGLPFNENKATWTSLVYRMLGIKGNHAEEFQKANIVIKVVSLEANGKLKESLSFKPFTFSRLMQETWEKSWVYYYFSETRFFFVVFQKQKNGTRILKGCFFWNMPLSTINTDLKADWDEIRNVIHNGVEFTWVQSQKPYMKNNFPSKSDTNLMHVRPHTKLSYYDLGDGQIYGSGKISDSDVLPDGRRMTKQSFWLNNSYIQKIIHENLNI